MSHIVLDAREFTTSTGRYMFKLIENLQELDADHDFTVLLQPHDHASWRPNNPRFKSVACPYKEFTFAEQLGFKRQLDGLRADLVHFGMTQQPVLYKGKHVTTVHDLTTLRFTNPSKNPVIFKVKQIVYGGVIKRVARTSSQIMVPSRYVQADLERYTHIPTDKVSVTYESSDAIKESAVPLPDLTNKQFIMYIGRPQPHKNLTNLIKSFKDLKKHHPSLCLVLAGKKDVLYERIEAQATADGVTDIVFTGFISEGQLRWLYEQCAAYVFPSLSEGFGLPGLEAMRHGAPVVSSNATCLPEIYGGAAHYFDPHDTADMSVKIDQVISDESLRAKLIDAGHAQAETYSWQRMAKQTLAIYEQVLSER